MESIVELTGRKKMMKKKEKMDIMMGLIDSMDDENWEILFLSLSLSLSLGTMGRGETHLG